MNLKMSTHIFKLSLILFFLTISFFSYKSFESEKIKRELKHDLIELSDIKYGMFNVDEWKIQFSNIITKKLRELKLTGNDKEKARKKIESLLYETIEKFELDYKKENEKNSLFGVSFRNIGVNFFEIFGKLKERVPVITEDILSFLEKKDNRENIKDYILLQLNKYRDSTFQEIDYSELEQILIKYESVDSYSCKKVINRDIEKIDTKIDLFNLIISVAYIIVLLYILIGKNHSNFQIVIFILTALHFLILGVFLPMIDIDARIGSMEFKLMGESIIFKDQVLYFKSKSIVEMSKIMLSQDKIKVMIVGVLVILFSVVFPILKLISSILIIFKRQLKENRVINFLVFKSGKWSMADVMVVAIFMSYIGFSGIISSQLNQLEKISTNLNILTTNNSELQYGFYFFLGFVIMSISISQIIMNRYEKPLANKI